ncbi:MAG: peptide chain release factor N(5)-glutamine methyltransferase [Clostridia bacterium]|nr:peptide chain release factor N(5)-glutamine methyltransferase [Clostridia bacterium]
MSEKKVKTEKEPKKKKGAKNCTYIGGQAVLEGVMMMGKTCMATAVRDPDGAVQIEARRIKRGNAAKTAAKIPFVRGVVNLVSSLVRGIKTLSRSAAVYGDEADEEEPGKVQKWFVEKFKVSLMDVVTGLGMFIGILLAVGIFFVLPNYLVGLLTEAYPEVFQTRIGGLWSGLLLGGIKLVIFLAYLGLILLLKDIRRLYRYHGAEHKTINAYEQGVELVPEKVAECSRIHDRCGTSFLFIVLFINIVIYSVLRWACYVNEIENPALRYFTGLELEILLLPVIAGVAYEVLKLLAKYDNRFVRALKAPGMLLQKYLTTREPDEKMIEVAIAAFKKVLEMDADEKVPETVFVTSGILSKMLEETKKKFAEKEIDESDAEWIYAIVLGLHRSDLKHERTVKPSESKRISEIVEQRLAGRPLWYIIGDTEFCNCKIKVDERALIPRPETEILADTVIRSVEDNDKVLDMCTGSGCIAVAVAKACKGRGVSVTAADVSDAAIMLAKENANLNSVDVSFVVSDLFKNVHGRYNIIVCNPPYIKSTEIPYLQREVREHEPRVALDGGEDGLEFYRRLASEVKSYLTKDGMLIMECGEGQTTEILQIFPKRDYAIVLKDLAGVERFLKIVF